MFKLQTDPTYSESAVTLLSAQSNRPTRPRVLGSQLSTRPYTGKQQQFQTLAAPRKPLDESKKASVMKDRYTQR